MYELGARTPRDISIHAPHEGERPVREVGREIPISISIHAPHEGERRILKPRVDKYSLFQSTLPTRGSDAEAARTAGPSTISIHAPHEGERR